MDVRFIELLETAGLGTRNASYTLHADHTVEVLRPTFVTYASGMVASMCWDAEINATVYLLAKTYNASVSGTVATKQDRPFGFGYVAQGRPTDWHVTELLEI